MTEQEENRKGPTSPDVALALEAAELMVERLAVLEADGLVALTTALADLPAQVRTRELALMAVVKGTTDRLASVYQIVCRECEDFEDSEDYAQAMRNVLEGPPPPPRVVH